MEKKAKVIINSNSQSQESYSVEPEMKATACTENVLTGDELFILDKVSLPEEIKNSTTKTLE